MSYLVKCKSPNPTAVRSSFHFARVVNIHESQWMDGRDDTDITNSRCRVNCSSEWSNFSVAERWLDLAVHMTKPRKPHSHQYMLRPPPKPGPPFKCPCYLWGISLSFTLTGNKQTKDKAEQQNLHLVDSRDPYSVEAEGVPVVGEDAKSLPLL